MALLHDSKQGGLKVIGKVGGNRKFFWKKKKKGSFVGKPGPGALKTFDGSCKRCHRRGHIAKDCKIDTSCIQCMVVSSLDIIWITICHLPKADGWPKHMLWRQLRVLARLKHRGKGRTSS